MDKFLTASRMYTSTVKVRKDNVAGFLDVRIITQLRTDYKNLSMYDSMTLRDNSLLGLMTYETPTIVHSIKIREVTGRGKSKR